MGKPTKKIAVIGAGISGLACAYELKKRGFVVDVFEKSSYPGGRMATREKKGLLFDIGANFFIGLYKNTKAYCGELGIPGEWEQNREERQYVFRGGKLHYWGLNNLWTVLRYSALSPLGRLRLLKLFYSMRNVPDLEYFDLSNNPKGFDTNNAYDYAKRIAGQEVADYIVDSFTSTYQFHRSNEISILGKLAFMKLMSKHPEEFDRFHLRGGMIALPNRLAKKVNAKFQTPVQEFTAQKKEIILKLHNNKKKYDALVIATTASVAKSIYTNPSPLQRDLLSLVRYAATINVSFSIPKEILGDIGIVSVPYVESTIICQYSNEVKKCIESGNRTLLNVGLHEEFARKLMQATDQEIYALIKKEVLRVCPPLQTMESQVLPHDLVRWEEAMPKFDHKYVSKVQEFWDHGQGDNNVYFCGDYLNGVWIEGSIICGKKVAKRVEESFQATKA